MFGGFDIPREQREAAQEEYEDTLRRCASGQHPEQHVSFTWDWYGNPEVPGGTVTFKVYTCGFCYQEWA